METEVTIKGLGTISGSSIKCGACNSSNTILVEWRGAYDGWLAVECQICGKQTHRGSGEEIIKSFQYPEYGPAYFRTKGGYYRNFTKISKEDFNSLSSKRNE